MEALAPIGGRRYDSLRGDKMSIKEWVTIGIKLLGVYFSVLAFTSLALSLIHLAGSAIGIGPGTLVMDQGLIPLSMQFAQPAAYIIASYVLIKKTEWCLEKIGIEK